MNEIMGVYLFELQVSERDYIPFASVSMKKMASSYDNVQVSILSDDERFVNITDEPVKLELFRQSDSINLTFSKGNCRIALLTPAIFVLSLLFIVMLF